MITFLKTRVLKWSYVNKCQCFTFLLKINNQIKLTWQAYIICNSKNLNINCWTAMRTTLVMVPILLCEFLLVSFPFSFWVLHNVIAGGMHWSKGILFRQFGIDLSVRISLYKVDKNCFNLIYKHFISQNPNISQLIIVNNFTTSNSSKILRIKYLHDTDLIPNWVWWTKDRVNNLASPCNRTGYNDYRFIVNLG